VKLLFLARHANYFRNFEGVVRLLAERGHQVHLAVERGESVGGSTLLDQLTAAYAGVTAGEAPRREAGDAATMVGRLRRAIDLLRYLEPAYDATPRLRARAAERAPAFAAWFAGSGWSRVGGLRSALGWLLRRAEAAVRQSRDITEYLADQRADAFLVTPLIGVVGSSQLDYLRAARAAGLPTAVAVWSWDHLTSKALIRDAPDRVIVWNDVQRDEAVRLHGIPAHRVVVTGAQCFDHWFGRRPSRGREAFCAAVGLPAERPYLLYVGSALFAGSPSEAAFVQRWIAAIRASADPALRSCAVLVRPHPQRMREWDGVDLSTLGDVAVWGGNPVTDQARADYFDSLAHSRAVVGLNTSAFLEAAIAGRPVLAILPDEFRDNQEGTLHFGYLSTVGGGLLRTSRTLDEHRDQLSQLLATPDGRVAHEAFVRAFIRPHGLDQPATPVFADAVEALARERVTQDAAAAAARPADAAGRLILGMFARMSASRRFGAWFLDEEERRARAWRGEKAKERAAHRRANLDPGARAEAEKDMRRKRTAS
jgi:hypothetical protein